MRGCSQTEGEQHPIYWNFSLNSNEGGLKKYQREENNIKGAKYYQGGEIKSRGRNNIKGAKQNQRGEIILRWRAVTRGMKLYQRRWNYMSIHVCQGDETISRGESISTGLSAPTHTPKRNHAAMENLITFSSWPKPHRISPLLLPQVRISKHTGTFFCPSSPPIPTNHPLTHLPR